MTKWLARKSVPRALVLFCLIGFAYAAPNAYVVNNKSAVITVIDLTTRAQNSQLSVGMGAGEMLILADNRTALLTEAGSNPGLLRKIDLISGNSATVSVGATPGSIVVSRDGQTAYVANQDSNNVSVVATNWFADPSSMSLITDIAVGQTPVQVNQSFDGKYVYSVNQGSGDISVIDTASRAVIGQPIALPSGHPNQMAMHPSGKAFVPAPDANAVYVFDSATNSFTGQSFNVPGASIIVFSPDLTNMAVLTQGSAIYVYRLSSTGDATYRFTLTSSGRGVNAFDMAFTWDNNYAYVAYHGNGTTGGEVDVCDLTSSTPSCDPVFTTGKRAWSDYGSAPMSISFDPDENYVFAVLGAKNEVAVVSTASDAVQTGIPAGTAPLALVQLNQPYVTPGGVVNAASYSTTVAGGAIVAIFGEGLVSTGDSAKSLPLPTAINQTQVFFDDLPAPLFYTSGLQINAMVPSLMLGKSSATLRIVGPNGSDTSTVLLSPNASPGLFTVGSGGAIQHRSSDLVTEQNPAAPGELVVIYASGLGQTLPAIVDGQPPAVVSPTVAPATVTIGGVTSEAYWAGLTGGASGLYQVNAYVPAGLPTGSYPVTVEVSGMTSNTVTLAVRTP